MYDDIDLKHEKNKAFDNGLLAGMSIAYVILAALLISIFH